MTVNTMLMDTANLTPQERRIVSLVMEGFSHEEIARELHVKEKAIRFHMTKVYAKFNILETGGGRSKSRLMAYLWKQGWGFKPATVSRAAVLRVGEESGSGPLPGGRK